MSTQYDRLQAEQRLKAAKRKFSEACAAGLRGDAGAAKLAMSAFKAVEACREELKRLSGLQLGNEMKRLRDERG